MSDVTNWADAYAYDSDPKRCKNCQAWHLHEFDHDHGECCAAPTNPPVKDRKTLPMFTTGAHEALCTRGDFCCSLWRQRVTDGGEA